MSKGRSPVVSVLARRALVLGLGVAAIAWPAGQARPAAASTARTAPVASLQPAATARLWKQLVRRPTATTRPADCRPLRLTFYAPTDWLRLATRLAANPSRARSTTSRSRRSPADKTKLRPDQAWRIRALGPNFHALAEINVTRLVRLGRRRTAAAGSTRASRRARRWPPAGYDVAAGDTWALNEVSSAVRAATGSARAEHARLHARPLRRRRRPAARPRASSSSIGVGQATADLSTYKANSQGWYRRTAPSGATWSRTSATGRRRSTATSRRTRSPARRRERGATR